MFFFLIIRLPPRTTRTHHSCPTRRSSDLDFQNLSRAARDLQNLPLSIDDTPGLTIAALRTRARRLKRRHNVGFIVVDYLQLLQGSSKGGDNRVDRKSTRLNSSH